MISELFLAALLAEIAKVLNENFREELRLARGVEKELEKMESECHAINAVLIDAAKRDVNEESFFLWRKKLKDICGEATSILKEWTAQIQNPSRSFLLWPYLVCKRIKFRRDIAHQIRKINAKLAQIASVKDRYKLTDFGGESSISPRSTSFVVISDILGRDLERVTMINQVLVLPKSDQIKDLNIVSVIGPFGIGKTALAQVVFNSAEVIVHFPRRIWVCVSSSFDEIRITRAILEDIQGSAPNLFQLQSIVKEIRAHLEGERVFLVLDNVCTDDDFRKYEHVFDSLGTGAAGSTILVTTTRESVPVDMGSSYVLRLGLLSDDDSWILFKKFAFAKKSREDCERLEGVGRMIAGKCKGSPHTLKKIGRVMRSKEASLEDWEDVLNNGDYFL